MQKTAIVTGANKGIGLEIAQQLARKKYRVYMVGRSQSRIESAAQELLEQGLDVIAVAVDVNDAQQRQNWVAALKNEGVTVDILINNAGVLYDWDLNIFELSEDQIRDTIETNALAPLFLTRDMIPLMKSGSKVIMISSGAGATENGVRQWAPIYSSSKSALNVFTRHLAYSLEPKGIAVAAVSPGWVRTDMGGAQADRSVAEGAETPVWLAEELTLENTGYFWRDKTQTHW